MREAAEAAPGRTWWVTLTGTMEFHLAHRYAARVDEMTPDEATAAMIKAEGRHLRLGFQRLREHLGYAPRHLFVAEPHLSGDIHWHGLIHETTENTITKRMLSGDPDRGKISRFWKWTNTKGDWSTIGFVQARLCEPSKVEEIVWYVTDYLKKDCHSRTRASPKYGFDKPI